MVKKKTVAIKASKDARLVGKRPNISRWAKKSQRKRPGRHAKNYSKRIPMRSKTRGQG
mgnify:CR=1 FL=1